MDEVWQSSPFFVEPLRPPGLQAKAGWKTFEAELQFQSQYCHDKLQRDLGNMHVQVLNEVHAAELQRVAHSLHQLQAAQSQAHHDAEQMWEAIGGFHVDVKQWRKESQEKNQEMSEVMAEVPSLRLFSTRISAAGGQELFNAKMASNTTVAGLKEELLLLLFIPRADQELVLSQQKVDDDICLADLYSLHQEEMQLYGLLRGDMESISSRMVEGQVHLDFTLFLQSGFYLFHPRVSGVRSVPPGRGVCSFRICEDPLRQRIFVEKVLPGPSIGIGNGNVRS
eukprot:symbB.v1.2.031703.t1/scaffold3622.1/size97564/2